MHYLDNAATSHPKPSSVADSMARAVRDLPGNASRGGGRAPTLARAAIDRARLATARFFSADFSRVIFTSGATDGLAGSLGSLVAGMSEGAIVVTTTLEHAAIARPLRRLARSGRIVLRRVAPLADGRLDPTDIATAAKGAHLVAMTVASNVTGVVQPIGDIAAALRELRIPLLLDAAQAAGSADLDARELGENAVIACSAHKGLLGPMGVGVLLVGAAIELTPWREGGTGSDSESLDDPMPARLEAGTLPLPAIAGLEAALAWWESEGPARLRAREQDAFSRLLDDLAAVRSLRVTCEPTAAPRVPLVSFTMSGLSPVEIETVLDREFDVTVRAGLHCAPDAHRQMGTWPDGAVRASLGPLTTPADIDALVAGLRSLAS